MILGAGLGQRMEALCENTPKVLLPVAGKALIDYHLENLAGAGVTDVVINVHYLAQQIQDHVGNGAAHGLTIHYSPEAELLGMGGGVYNALPLLGDAPFMVVSGDMWTDYNYARLPQQLDGLAHLVMVDNPAFHPEGDFCLEAGRILEKGETNLNYAGFGVFHPRFFAAGGPGSYGVSTLLQQAIPAKQVSGEYYSGQWANLNTAQQLQTLESRLASAPTEQQGH
jgi:MurNAc alpha-1-phosphate uridylyltransferase